MTIRILPGNHIEVFCTSRQLHELAANLHTNEIIMEGALRGLIEKLQQSDTTMRNPDGSAVVRFRPVGELGGVVPDPAVYSLGMPKGSGCQ